MTARLMPGRVHRGVDDHEPASLFHYSRAVCPKLVASGCSPSPVGLNQWRITGTSSKHWQTIARSSVASRGGSLPCVICPQPPAGQPHGSRVTA